MNQRMEKLIGLRKVAALDFTRVESYAKALAAETTEQMKVYDELISSVKEVEERHKKEDKSKLNMESLKTELIALVDAKPAISSSIQIGLKESSQSQYDNFITVSARYLTGFGRITLVNDFSKTIYTSTTNFDERKELKTGEKIQAKRDTGLKIYGFTTDEKYISTYLEITPDIFSKLSDREVGIRSILAENYPVAFSGKKPASDGGGKKPTSGGGGSKSPQTTSGEILIDEAHRGLTGLVDANNKDYVYNTDPNGAWADFTNKGVPGKRLDKDFPNWAKFVAELNTYPTTGATKVAPAATTPTTAPTGADAAKAPVPEGEAAGVQTRRVVSDAVVMNVAKVLTDVYGGATYAGRTVLRNEMGMVRKMMDQLNSTAQSLGVTIGSAEALAQIITPSIRPGLGRFGTANLDGLGERDMEKQYRTELNLIMTAVKNLFDRIKKSPAQLLNYQPNLRDAAIALKQKREGTKAPVAGTTPAATPAPSAPATPAPSTAAASAPATGGAPAANAAPTAAANDGSSFGKKSSQSSKFKKLAKLRRLRVRGQMEAATEPSARLGVSRIS